MAKRPLKIEAGKQSSNPELGSWSGVPTLSMAVADWISSEILAGRWQVGDRLQEVDVATLLGVSRGPVREAFRTLHARGVIHHRPRQGAVVSVFSAETIGDIYELRAMFEAWTCERSVPLLQASDLKDLRVTLAKMRVSIEMDDIGEFYDLAWSFRETLYSQCPNSAALEVVRYLRARLRAFPAPLRDDPASAHRMLTMCESVLPYAEGFDGPGAARLMSELLIEWGSGVRKRFEAVRQTQPATPRRAT